MQVAAELERFAAAVALSLKQLRKLKAKADGLPGTAAEEVGYLLDAHLAHARQFAPRARRRAAHRERAHQRRARGAWTRSREIGESFAEMGDAYLAARVEDIRVVGARLLRNLTKTPYAAFQGLPEGTVILAEELTPADTALIDPRRIAGFRHRARRRRKPHRDHGARAQPAGGARHRAGCWSDVETRRPGGRSTAAQARHPQPDAGDHRAL